MQQQKQLGTIVDGLLEQVQAYGIKDITICEYQFVCHKLLSYAQEKGDFFYSKRLTDEFRILKTTKEGYLTINCEASCLLKNSKIAIFLMESGCLAWWQETNEVGILRMTVII